MKIEIILFDAPPILATTEALSLLDHMGQIMFVVEAGKTPSEYIDTAISQINPEKVIGTILNKNRYKTRDAYYGGYYGKKSFENKEDQKSEQQ
jgi:receptor protein-tyrosine kinase